MKPKLTYQLNQKKNFEEILYDCSVWINEFKFIETESNFLELILNSYPFKRTIPNLFERLQLFVLELEQVRIDGNTILNGVNLLAIEINNTLKRNEEEKENSHLDIFKNITTDVIDYMDNYKTLKGRIYEYLYSLIAV